MESLQRPRVGGRGLVVFLAVSFTAAWATDVLLQRADRPERRAVWFSILGPWAAAAS